MRRRPHIIILALLMVSLIGCSADISKSGSLSKTGSAGKTTDPSGKQPKSTEKPRNFAQLFPIETVAYLRIHDVQRVKDELISAKHVKDAAKVQERINTLILDGIKSLAANGSKLGVTFGSLTRFVFGLKSIHVGLVIPVPAEIPMPEPLVILESNTAEGLEALRSDLQPKLKRDSVGKAEIHLLAVEGQADVAIYFLNATTIAVGPKWAVSDLVRRKQSPEDKTLATSAAFRKAVEEWGQSGELFLFVDYRGAGPIVPNLPFSMVSHFAIAIGLEGVFSMRAYSADGKAFPKFLVRTPREKKFLSRIPEDAAFLIGTGTNADRESRRNFVDWVMQELGQDSKSATQLLPERMQKLAQAYLDQPDKIETEAITLLKDMWAGVLPVKSESAFFVAPDAKGRWGAAFLFDVQDRHQAAALATKLRGIGDSSKFTWKQSRYANCDIHYIDFADVAKQAGHPVSASVANQTQLQVGYAITDELFLVGTVESIRFALKPTGTTLVKKFPYDNIDEKNAIMLTLQPGRILHRTFGVPEVDDVLKRLASQIPRDSSYSVTLNFEPKQLTLRTNIPFISLFGWLLVEMTSEGPAGLRSMIPKPAP